MLTKYKDVRPKKSVKSPLKVFSCLRRIEEFFSGKGHSKLPCFQAFCFSGKIILKHVENEKGFRGVRGHAPPENFENLHTIVAILALFEQFFKIFSP